MLTRTILCVAFLGTATVSLDDSYPKYTVAPGTKLSRTWTTTSDIRSGPAKGFFDDEEIPSEGHPTMKLRVSDERITEVVDEIETVVGGRPTRFQRTYAKLANRGIETVIQQPHGGDATERENARDRTSPLQGRTVGFVWNAEDEAYERAFVGAEKKKGDDDLLQGLVAETEWLALIADGPRAKGDTFDLPESLFPRFQSPLGELCWQIDGKEADAATKEINAELTANMDGEGKLVWAGVRETDGKQLGVFEIEAKLASKADAATGQNGEKRTVELEFDYAGEILWDMAAGHLAGYEVEADVTSTLSNSRQVEMPKGKGEMRQVFELEGTTKHKLVVGPE